MPQDRRRNQEKTVKVTPLGGVGEVGKNIMVVEYDGEILAVDCGLAFPEEDMLGVDLLLPDISYLRQSRKRFVGYLITHGHEDHIGGLPYILRDMPGPVYATPLTRGLIEVKLKEAGLLGRTDLHTFRDGDTFKIGGFTIEPFHVTHSIPDATGVAITCGAGTVVYTGDFKFDPTPVDGRLPNFGRMAELGNRGVLALLSDCVRVETPGHTPSEQLVGETFRKVFAQAPGRVIIATFASLIARIQQVINVAEEYGRKVAVVGRSLENNVEMAQRLGYLQSKRGTIVPAQDLAREDPQRSVLIVTGSQGEPTSVLNRIANRDHRHVRLQEGDTVLISATPIPGNETAVSRIINSLFKQGANVIYSDIERVHVSGHAARDELRLMLNLMRPRYVAPVHGETRHLVMYKRLAMGIGIPEKNILIPENGSVMEFGPQGARIAEQTSNNLVFVDGVTVGEVDHVVLRDRQRLSQDGMVIVVLTIERDSGRLVAGPDIVSRGFVDGSQDGKVTGDARDLIRRAFTHDGSAPTETSWAHRKIKNVLGQYLFEKTGRRPMVLPVVMEV
jgi:ribonuclease J